MRFWTIPSLIICFCTVTRGAELFRFSAPGDLGASIEYIFEANPELLPNTVDQAAVVKVASNWAKGAYDRSLDLVEVVLKTTPTTYWKVAFKDADARLFFAAVLPNGSIVHPAVLAGM